VNSSGHQGNKRLKVPDIKKHPTYSNPLIAYSSLLFVFLFLLDIPKEEAVLCTIALIGIGRLAAPQEKGACGVDEQLSRLTQTRLHPVNTNLREFQRDELLASSFTRYSTKRARAHSNCGFAIAFLHAIRAACMPYLFRKKKKKKKKKICR